MRYITNLSYDTLKLLNCIYKKSKSHEVRQRAHCILLSFKGYSISQLVEVFGVHLNTIYNWLNAWEKERLVCLIRSKGQGRKPKLEDINIDEFREIVEKNPKQLRKVASELNAKYGILVSVRTIIRRIKKN